MKSNLNSINRLINHFYSAEKGTIKEDKYQILDDIFHFGSKKILVQNPIDRKQKKLPIRNTDLHIDTITYQSDTDFYRIRKLLNTIPNPKQEDFWAPEPKHSGRLNSAKEAFLYITTESMTAHLEANIQKGDIYFLIFYKAIKEISLSQIFLKNYDPRNSVQKAKFDFLNKLFSREGKKAYDISRFIAHRYLNTAPEGWRYNSVKNPEGNNICLLSSQECLNINYVLQIENGIAIACHYLENNSVISITDKSEVNRIAQAIDAEHTRKPAEPINLKDTDFIVKVLPPLNNH